MSFDDVEIEDMEWCEELKAFTHRCARPVPDHQGEAPAGGGDHCSLPPPPPPPPSRFASAPPPQLLRRLDSLRRPAPISKMNCHFVRNVSPGLDAEMLIPQAIVENMYTELENGGEEATLVSSNGKTWHVQVYTKDSDFYMGGEEWKQFVKASNLQVGEILTFRYKDNMMFRVRIFDQTTGCEKIHCSSSYPHDGRGENVSRKKVNRGEDNSYCGQEPAVQSSAGDSSEFCEEVVPLGVRPESSRACIHPGEDRGHFEVKIIAYHLKNSNTLIPAAFRCCSGLSREDREVCIRDPMGRMWYIGLHWRKDRRDVYMASKWTGFAKENRLAVGDTCIFDLVEQGEPKVFQLAIIRANDQTEYKYELSQNHQ